MNFRLFFTNHTWWGKIIGAVLGYLIGGPMGALFGILIGNFFDRGLAEHFSRPYWQYHAEKRTQVQALFFEATFSVMGHLAKAGGRVSEQEIQMANTLMREMRLSGEQRKRARHFFNEGKKHGFQLKRILILLKQATYDNPDLLKLFIHIQYRAAQVEGLNSKKLEIMNHILTILGFAPLYQQHQFYEDFLYEQAREHTRSRYRNQSHSSSYQSSHNPIKTSLGYAYAILGISAAASKQDVKRAYRRLISQNHPDKLIARGASKDEIKRANETTQKIRKAYEQICASKGW